MNVDNYTQHALSVFQQRLRRAETSNDDVNVQVNNSNSVSATMQQDDFASQIWNMTDSMPRENQISFTATVLANRMTSQGVTNANKAFLKNVSNRFSADELGTLKAEILSDPSMQTADKEVVQEFMNSLDEIMNKKANDDLQSQLKQQNLHKFRTPDEIFFQTTLLFDATRKGMFGMGDQEAINYDKA